MIKSHAQWTTQIPYNTAEDWAERLQGGTVLHCEIQQGTGPWEASDWMGKKVKGRIAAVDQWGTAKAGWDTPTCHRNRTAALGNPGKMEGEEW